MQSASERAAAAQAQMQQDKLSQMLDQGHRFPELSGLSVRGNVVSVPGFWGGSSKKPVGPLAGSCAGIIEARQPTIAAHALAVYNASAPKAGRVFIAFADGSRHERKG